MLHRFQTGFISGNIGAGILFICLVIYVIWFLSASTPMLRVERVCRPVYWFGSIWVSTAELTGSKEGIVSMLKMREDMDFSCRYIVWKQFYYDDWMKQKEQEARSDDGNKSR